MKVPMGVEWYFGCANEDDRERRRDVVLSSYSILKVLKEYLTNKKDTLSMREEDYDVAAWAYLQAHRNGRIDELDRLIKLIGSAIDHDR